MPRPEHHLFVCQNERPVGGKPSCAARGGRELFAALQREVGSRPELWGQVAVTSAGCLGPCFEGPTLVAYPEGHWYCGVKPEDAAEIIEQAAQGKGVARLRYDFDDNDDPG